MLSDPEDEFDENAGNYSTTSSQKTAKQSQEHNDDWEQDFSSQEKVSNAWSNSSKVEQNQYFHSFFCFSSSFFDFMNSSFPH